MATRTERLYEEIKDYEWEYGISRFVKTSYFTIKSNMNENLDDVFIGYITNRDSRDPLSIKYSCPVKKIKRFKNGRLREVELDYEESKWELIPRQKRREKE